MVNVSAGYRHSACVCEVSKSFTLLETLIVVTTVFKAKVVFFVLIHVILRESFPFLVECTTNQLLHWLAKFARLHHTR